MRAVRYIAAICLIAIPVVALFNSSWKARLATGEHVRTLSLGTAPAWSPPPHADYAQFRNAYSDLPNTAPSDARIERMLDVEWAGLQLLFYLWLSCNFVSTLYVAVRRQRSDAFLSFAICIALSLTVFTFAWLMLWPLSPSWPPLWPVILGLLGVVCGILLGFARLSRRRKLHHHARRFEQS